MAILEFVSKVEITSFLIDCVAGIGVQFCGFWANMGRCVEGIWSMVSHLILCSSLCSMTKSNRENSVCILRICSSRILVKLWRGILYMDSSCVVSLLGREFFVWSILSFLSNTISCSLHKFMNSHVKIFVSWIDFQIFSVISLGWGSVIVNIRYSIRSCEMVLRGMVKDHLDVSMLSELYRVGAHHHVMFPHLIWFGPRGSSSGRFFLRVVVWMHFLHLFCLGLELLFLNLSWSVMACLRPSASLRCIYHMAGLMICHVGDCALFLIENWPPIFGWRIIHLWVESLIKSICFFNWWSHLILVKFDAW